MKEETRDRWAVVWTLTELAWVGVEATKLFRRISEDRAVRRAGALDEADSIGRRVAERVLERVFGNTAEQLAARIKADMSEELSAVPRRPERSAMDDHDTLVVVFRFIDTDEALDTGAKEVLKAHFRREVELRGGTQALGLNFGIDRLDQLTREVWESDRDETLRIAQAVQQASQEEQKTTHESISK